MTNAALNGKPYAGNPHVRFEVGALFTVVLTVAVGVARADRPPVRMIAHGHDTLSADTRMLLENADRFDALPIDGVPIMLKAKGANGALFSGFTLPYNEKWEYAAFSNELDNVRAILKHPSLKHSFLSCWFGLPKWGAKPSDRLRLTEPQRGQTPVS